MIFALAYKRDDEYISRTRGAISKATDNLYITHILTELP